MIKSAWNNVIQFVKGGIEPGEMVEETALRELFEETGLALDASCITLLGSYSRGASNDVIEAEQTVVLATLPEG